MRFGRLQCLTLAIALWATVGMKGAQAGPLAVVADFTDPSLLNVFAAPWPAGTVSVIDTATDLLVTTLKVGVNPTAVAITPDGKTAVVACSQSSELYFVDLAGTTPSVLGKLSVGSGSGDTFYPAGLTISPDGEFVAVTSMVGSATQKSTQIKNILLVKISDRSLVQTLDVSDSSAPLTAEAAAFTPHNSLVVVGPSASPPVVFGLGYESGEIQAPEIDEGTQKNAFGGLQNSTGFNVTIAPDGSYAIVPLGRGADGTSDMVVLHIDGTGKITDEQATPQTTGGDGPHSVAISPDGKFAYVRNLLPPQANIAVFAITAGPTLTDTGLRLSCEGIPQGILDLEGFEPGALGYVGSQMLAITPDGKKIYAANPFGGRAASFLIPYGVGNVLVFDPTKAAPTKTLAFGRNPIAVAIQPK